MVCTIGLRAHDLARSETSIQGVFTTGRLQSSLVACALFIKTLHAT
jgi:hypothetical protein